MPPDPLTHSNIARDLTDLTAHERLSQVGLSALAERTGEDPVAGGLVLRVKPPGAERSREKRVEWNRLLRRLRLA
jgi:hypothetical protein